MAFPEVPSSPDWYNENLKSEIQSLIPGILDDFQTEKAAGTLFAYERLPLDSSDKKFLEAYALLKLVKVSQEVDLPAGDLRNAVHYTFREALERYRKVNRGDAASEVEAEYLFWTEGLGEALSFLKTSKGITPDPNSNPKSMAYENIVLFLVHEGRTQEALPLLPLTDFSKGSVGDSVYTLSAYQWLAKGIPIQWPEYKRQWVERIKEQALGQFVVETFIHRERLAGRIDDVQALFIAQDYGDKELILETHAEVALRSLQKGDLLGMAEYKLFQEWVSEYIKGSFRKDSLLFKNNIDWYEQTYWLCKIARQYHSFDPVFAQELLLEAEKRAGLAFVEADIESRFVGREREANLGSFILVYETALATGNQDLADKVEKLMGAFGLHSNPAYCESFALAWLPYDRERADWWFQFSWGEEYFPKDFLLTQAAKSHDFKDIVGLAEEHGRSDDYGLCRDIILLAIQEGDSVWKDVLAKLPVILQIFALRDVLTIEKKQKLGLPKESMLSLYLWGREI